MDNGNKLFVGNLPFKATKEELEELFTGAGIALDSNAPVQMITDRETGRSRGFAFVTVMSQQDVKKALDALNGKDFQGRNLVVNPARPRNGE